MLSPSFPPLNLASLAAGPSHQTVKGEGRAGLQGVVIGYAPVIHSLNCLLHHQPLNYHDALLGYTVPFSTGSSLLQHRGLHSTFVGRPCCAVSF